MTPMHSEVRGSAAPKGWHAAALNVVTRLSGAALSFALAVVLARALEPAAFGQVSLVLAWLALGTVVGCAGMPLSVVRYVAENIARGRPEFVRGAMAYGLAAAFAASMALAAAAWGVLHADFMQFSAAVLRVADVGIALIVPNVMLTVVGGILQGMQRAVAAEVMNSIFRPMLMLLGLAALWPGAQRPALDAPTVLWLYFEVAVVLLVGGGLLVMRWQAQVREGWHVAFSVREWSAASVGMLGVLIALAAAERLDMLLLGIWGTEHDMAVYAVSLRFHQTLLMALNAVGAVVAPRFIGCLPALREGNQRPAQEIVHEAARWSLLGCLAAWACFLFLGPWLVPLFGARYAGAHPPLMILVTGQVLAAVFGPALIVGTMAGHTKLVLTSQGAGMAVNAGLNFMLVGRWGPSGAAFAAAAGAIVAAAVARTLVSRQVGIATSPVLFPR